MAMIDKNENTSMPQYSALAPYYEKLNEEVDYSGWADFLSEQIKKYCPKKPEIVLELACGTGAMTRMLAKRGYDMIGIDISEEMLAEAARMEYADEDDTTATPRRRVRRGTKPLYICQDIRDFELYGTVGAAVCCLDGINYLTEDGDIDRCLSTLYTYLEQDGIFVFDVNTPYKFENVFSDRDYVLESDGVLCAWQNDYDRETGLCDFYLSIFTEEEDGCWSRASEQQRERCYTRDAIESALSRNGFKVLSVLGDRNDTPATDTDERWYFIAKRN